MSGARIAWACQLAVALICATAAGQPDGRRDGRLEVHLAGSSADVATLAHSLRDLPESVRVVPRSGTTSAASGSVEHFGDADARYIEVDARASERVRIAVHGHGDSPHVRDIRRDPQRPLDAVTAEAVAAIVASLLEALASEPAPEPTIEQPVSGSDRGRGPSFTGRPPGPAASPLPAPALPTPTADTSQRERAQPSHKAQPTARERTGTTGEPARAPPPGDDNAIEASHGPGLFASYEAMRWRQQLWLHGLSLNLRLPVMRTPLGVRVGAWLTPAHSTLEGDLSLQVTAYAGRVLAELHLASLGPLALSLASGVAGYLVRAQGIDAAEGLHTLAPSSRLLLAFRSELRWELVLIEPMLAQAGAGLEVAPARIHYGIRSADGFARTTSLERVRFSAFVGLGVHF